MQEEKKKKSGGGVCVLGDFQKLVPSSICLRKRHLKVELSRCWLAEDRRVCRHPKSWSIS